MVLFKIWWFKDESAHIEIVNGMRSSDLRNIMHFKPLVQFGCLGLTYRWTKILPYLSIFSVFLWWNWDGWNGPEELRKILILLKKFFSKYVNSWWSDLLSQKFSCSSTSLFHFSFPFSLGLHCSQYISYFFCLLIHYYNTSSSIFRSFFLALTH